MYSISLLQAIVPIQAVPEGTLAVSRMILGGNISGVIILTEIPDQDPITHIPNPPLLIFMWVGDFATSPAASAMGTGRPKFLGATIVVKLKEFF